MIPENERVEVNKRVTDHIKVALNAVTAVVNDNEVGHHITGFEMRRLFVLQSHLSEFLGEYLNDHQGDASK